MTDAYKKIFDTIITKQKEHNNTVKQDINSNVQLQPQKEQQYVNNPNVSNFQNVLYKAFFNINKKQSKINSQFIKDINKEQNLIQTEKNHINKQLDENQKLWPNNKNLKPITHHTKSNKNKSIRTKGKFKNHNLQSIIKLKTQKTQTKTYITSLPQDHLDSSFASDIQSKNQYLRQQLQRRRKILQLYQEKNKLQHRLHQINGQLTQIRKKSGGYLSMHIKTENSQQKKKIVINKQQRPFVFLSPNHSHNKLNLYKYQQNKINKSSVLPKLSHKSPINRKNPQYMQEQIQKTQKAVQFITRINKDTYKRKLKFQKFQEHVIIDNIMDVSLSCSRKRCRRQVLQGKVRQLQKQF